MPTLLELERGVRPKFKTGLKLHDWFKIYGKVNWGFGKWVNIARGPSYKEGLLLMGLVTFVLSELSKFQHNYCTDLCKLQRKRREG